MPIYEFRCFKCQEIFELLFTSSSDTIEMKCPHCGATELEKVMSATNYSMTSPGGGPKATGSTKSCGSGSCGTIEIPGAYD